MQMIFSILNLKYLYLIGNKKIIFNFLIVSFAKTTF